MMIRSDEVERALWMLDNMPSWYRANYPVEAKVLKQRLLKNIMTVTDYQKEKFLIEDMGKDYASYPRLNILVDLLQKHKDKACLLYDVGPGNHWLVDCLETDHGLDVGYMYDGIASVDMLQDKTPGDFNVFTAFEIIEHLWQPLEIVQYYQNAVARIGREFNAILMSTPCNTHLGGSDSDWRSEKLGHLRCYNPKEFSEFAVQNFPDFQWGICVQSSMVLIGTKK